MSNIDTLTADLDALLDRVPSASDAWSRASGGTKASQSSVFLDYVLADLVSETQEQGSAQRDAIALLKTATKLAKDAELSPWIDRVDTKTKQPKGAQWAIRQLVNTLNHELDDDNKLYAKLARAINEEGEPYLAVVTRIDKVNRRKKNQD